MNEATRAFEEALRLHRAFGQERSTVYPIEGLGDALAASGDFPGATAKLQEAFEIMRRTGEKESESSLLADLGDVFFEEGDLAKARGNYDNALELDNAAGYEEHLNQVRVDLAEVDMEQGKLSEAETLTTEALEEFTKKNLQDDEIVTHSVRVLVLLGQHKTVAALRECQQAEKISRDMQNRSVKLKFVIAAARVEAAFGKGREAEKALSAALAEAKRYGFAQRQFQAKLALGEIEMKMGRVKIGEDLLEGLENETTDKGFGLIGHKAALARKFAAL
jgi:tetratricopeptide (TPR) repeat protein